MSQTIESDHKIVSVSHLLSNTDQLKLTSFYVKTPSWRKALASELEKQAENKKKLLEKEQNKNNPSANGVFTGLNNDSKKTKTSVKSTKKTPNQPVGKFEHYIKHICGNILNIMIS